MRQISPEMALALALVASALIHVAALLGPGWALPALDEPEAAPTLDAVLVKPAPVVRPLRKPMPAPAAPPVAVVPAPTPGAAAVPVPESPPAAVPPAPAPVPVPQELPAAAPPPAVPLPVAISLPAQGLVRYLISKGPDGFVVGQATHTWSHDGLAYHVRSVTETTGLAALFKPARVVQESRGDVTATGLRPREFRHERVNGLDTARFDWTARTLVYAGQTDALPDGTQDMLSMYYQLVLDPPRVASELSIATGRKLERYRIEVLGEETLAMPRGERRALHLRTRSGNDSLELWIAPEGRGLPLKIRFIDRKGEIFDQVADDAEPRDNT